MHNDISIEQVSYHNPKDTRILQSCLETWFQNPKDLHLTNPTMGYPFNFNKWMTTYNAKMESITYVIKKNDWIIGHLSIMLRPQLNSIHIFHVFVDRKYRSKGYSKLLVNKALEYAKTNHINKITLAVNKNNPVAIKLYQTYCFELNGENKTGSYKMQLNISKSKNQ